MTDHTPPGTTDRTSPRTTDRTSPADDEQPPDEAATPAAGTASAAPISRRRFVAAGIGTALTAGIAGCSGTDGDAASEPTGPTDATATDSGDAAGGPDLPAVEDPPAAVYLPTHFEGMRHLEPVRAGDFELVPMVTYPHRFWTVTGDEVEPAVPSDEHVHLMVTVRDPETGTILPAATGLELEVGPEGEPGSVHAPWPMLSQEMGFHFGDNVPLGEDGTYEAHARVGAIDADLTGEFAGRFDEPGRASFTFEFDQAFRDEVVGEIEYLDEEFWGERGALANHVVGDHDDHHDDGDHHDDDDHGDQDDHHHPPHGREFWMEGEGAHRFGTFRRDSGEGELPPAKDLPGTLQGTPLTGDAVFAVTLLDRGSRFDDGDASPLAVSPRTPYNRSMLPMMSLGFEQTRDGSVLADGDLRARLDHDLGYHYAAQIEDVADGDEVTVTVKTPPQPARHAGYETAFREMPPVTVELEEP